MKNNEDLLKSLATQYVQEKGAEYQQELTELENAPKKIPLRDLDVKMFEALSYEKNVMRRAKRKRLMAWGSIAASLVIIVTITFQFISRPDFPLLGEQTAVGGGAGYAFPESGTWAADAPAAAAPPPAPAAAPPALADQPPPVDVDADDPETEPEAPPAPSLALRTRRFTIQTNNALRLP